MTEFQSLLKSSRQSSTLNLSQENNHSLQYISLPILPSSDSFPGEDLRSPSQSSLDGEWAEPVLCVSRGGLGSCRPLRVRSRGRTVVMVETERGTWPCGSCWWISVP